MSSTKTIGIIGGGQLGQMMAISAIYMGHKVITLDPAADCPSSRVSEVIVAPYDDVDALRQLADRCDVLTYEFENVDADGLDAVIKEGQLPQGTDLLRISQNRIFEKDFLSNKAKVTVAPYTPAHQIFRRRYCRTPSSADPCATFPCGPTCSTTSASWPPNAGSPPPSKRWRPSSTPHYLRKHGENAYYGQK